MHLRSVLCSACLGMWLVWLGASQVAHADGKLAQARREATEADDSDGSSDSRSHQQHGGHSHHHHECSRSFVEALICGLLPCSDSCDSEEVEASGVVSGEPDAPPLGYARYPYASPLAPYLLEPELQVASTSSGLDLQLHAERSIGRPFAGQLGLDAGYLDGIARSGLEARVLTPSVFELSARNMFLYEPSAADYSLFGAADLGFRFASLRMLLVRAFLGMLYFGKPGEMAMGAELGLGFELFLGRPWIVSARVVGGVLENDLLIPQARVQLGYLFGRTELFVGYDYLQVGSVNLGTPILGTRIWL